MKLAVKLFARARDLAGTSQLEVDVSEPATVLELKQALARACPALAPLSPHLLVAVGQEYAGDAQSLAEGLEVACFPPVSGG